MRSILKFSMPNDPLFSTVHDIPVNSVIRKVERQGADMMAWIEVETSNEVQEVTFTAYGTGKEIPAGHYYVGSFQSGAYVWHIFCDKFVERKP